MTRYMPSELVALIVADEAGDSKLRRLINEHARTRRAEDELRRLLAEPQDDDATKERR